MPRVVLSSYDAETDRMTDEIRKAMTSQKMNQAQLGRLLCVDQSMVSRYLARIDRMDVGTFRHMLKLLNLELKVGRKGE